MLLTFSLQSQFQKFGVYLGIAAFLGLAVLILLYFSHARELKRLRDWAGQAPERDHELDELRFEVAALRRSQIAVRNAAVQQASAAQRPAFPQRQPGVGASAGHVPGSAGQSPGKPGSPAPSASAVVSTPAVTEGPTGPSSTAVPQGVASAVPAQVATPVTTSANPATGVPRRGPTGASSPSPATGIPEQGATRVTSPASPATTGEPSSTTQSSNATAPTFDQSTQAHVATGMKSTEDSQGSSGLERTLAKAGPWIVAPNRHTVEGVLQENASIANVRDIVEGPGAPQKPSSARDDGTTATSVQPRQTHSGGVELGKGDNEQQSRPHSAQKSTGEPSLKPPMVLSHADKDQASTPSSHSQHGSGAPANPSHSQHGSEFPAEDTSAQSDERKVPSTGRPQPPRRAAALRASTPSKSPRRSGKPGTTRANGQSRLDTSTRRSSGKTSRSGSSGSGRGDNPVPPRTLLRRKAFLVTGGAILLSFVLLYATGVFGGGDSPSKKSAHGGKKSAKSSQKAAAPTRAQTKVAVLNGTTVSGLAKTVSDRVSGSGFARGSTGNHSDQQRAASLVLYAPGSRGQALEVARLLNITDVNKLDADTRSRAGQSANVVVVVGSDHTR